ncbi:MAG: helix-turn-helix domain-containing protein [Patescibacteria group bacterium]|jgi:sugar-specific transcriptional regulator TrmB
MAILGNLEGLLKAACIPSSQARVYLAGLELGNASLGDISKRSGLSKTTTFEALNCLHERKFVRITRRVKAVRYCMVDAEHVVALLRNAVAEQSAMIDDVARALPLFAALQGGDRPSTMIYEGAEAVDAYFMHLESVKPRVVDEIVHADDIYSWIDEKTLIAARKKYHWQPKSGRVLSSGKRRNPNPIFVQRRLSPSWGIFRGNLALYGNFVSVVTFTTRLTTIIIESKPLADSMRMLFEIAWRSSNDAE